MLKYPMLFTSTCSARQGMDAPWQIRSGELAASACVPVEFGGGGGGFSPEDLFAQALGNCFLATFQVYSQASKVGFGEVALTSSLTVDKNESGQPCMKQCHFAIEVRGTDRPDRVVTLVEKAMRSGFVLNSVKTDLTFTLQVNGEKVR